VGAFGFPVALELTGRPCVVVGDGEAAEAKVEALLEAGAEVTVVGDEPGPVLRALEDAGRIRLRRRPYRRGDLMGAFLAIAATGDRALNAAVHREADARRVLLNSVDDPGHSHFAVPSVLRRGDLVVAISTGGRAPALARRLRLELEDQLGPEYGELVDLLAEARREAAPVRTRLDFVTWARLWERALRADLAGLLRQGRADEVRHLVRAALTGEA
jgi:siroheme synthase-like protein